MSSNVSTISVRFGPFRLSGGALLFPGALLFALRTLWRYLVTGRALWGEARDNATLLASASKDFRDGSRLRLSGPVWHRLARRWALIAAPGLLYAVPATHSAAPRYAVAAWTAAACLLAICALRRATRRALHRDFVYPAAEAVCRVIKAPYSPRVARRMVNLPRDFNPDDAPPARWRRAVLHVRATWRELSSTDPDGDAPSSPGRLRRTVRRLRGRDAASPVRINLPAGSASLEAAQQKAIVRTAGAVLGMEDARAAWHLRGARPHVELLPKLTAPPLGSVTLPGLMAAIEAAPATAPLIGCSAGGRPEGIDYANDSPHNMISGGSGTGKSTLLRLIEAQRMRHGVGMIILDYKRVSHRWAHDLPGVIYAWRIADIHELCVRVGAELAHRIENVVPAGGDAEAPLVTFPVVDIVCEEMNSLAPLLAQYWQEVKPAGAPPRSPALAAIQYAVNMGREMTMHVNVVGQRVSANTLGPNGGDIRESFSTRLLAKWSTQTWKMLAGGLPFMRWPGGGRGVWARLTEEGVTIVRVPFLTTAQARALAMSGTPCPDTLMSVEGGHALPTGHGQPDIAASGHPALVTLAEAVPELPGRPLGLDALRKAASRDPRFPVASGMSGNAKSYPLPALQQWKAARDGLDQLEPAGAVFSDGSRRAGLVYVFYVLHDGAVTVGYVGQTRRTVGTREWEHRGDKPWADLVVGSAAVIEQGAYTDGELDAAELRHIRSLKPLFNYEGQEGAKHAIPKWTQVEQRHARDATARRPAWELEDRYVPWAK